MAETRQSLASKNQKSTEYKRTQRDDPKFKEKEALYQREYRVYIKKKLEIQANELENAKSEVIKLRKKVAKLTDIIEVCI